MGKPGTTENGKQAANWGEYADAQVAAVIEHLRGSRGRLGRIVRQLAAQPGVLAVSDETAPPGIVADFPVDGAERLIVQRAATQLSVEASTTLQLALPSNVKRLGLTIVNRGTVGATVCLSDNSGAAGQGIWLAPNGGAWDGRLGNMLWCGNISLIADSGTTDVSVVEV